MVVILRTDLGDWVDLGAIFTTNVEKNQQIILLFSGLALLAVDALQAWAERMGLA